MEGEIESPTDKQTHTGRIALVPLLDAAPSVPAPLQHSTLTTEAPLCEAPRVSSFRTIKRDDGQVNTIFCVPLVSQVNLRRVPTAAEATVGAQDGRQARATLLQLALVQPPRASQPATASAHPAAPQWTRRAHGC